MTTIVATDHLGDLDLTDGTDLILAGYDLGHPATRPVFTARPGANGAFDRSRFFGPRSVSVSVTVMPETAALVVDRLRGLTNPSTTAFLRFSGRPRSAPDVQVTGRGARLLMRSDLLESAGGVTRATMEWTVASGVLDSTVETSRTVPVAVSAEVGGRAYDLSFDRDYPDAQPAGTTPIVSAGTATTYPVIRMFGPCDGPTIQHTAADGTVSELTMPSLSIAAGDFVEIDTRERTVLYNANPADSRYSEIDFASSRWWAIAPGTQTVRFDPDTSSPPAQAEVVWRDAYI